MVENKKPVKKEEKIEEKTEYPLWPGSVDAEPGVQYQKANGTLIMKGDLVG
tara:strand:- start:11987 stop:12139 length:153 start_codon:yes stop_codon:yes gene_type:complete